MSSEYLYCWISKICRAKNKQTLSAKKIDNNYISLEFKVKGITYMRCFVYYYTIKSGLTIRRYTKKEIFFQRDDLMSNILWTKITTSINKNTIRQLSFEKL